MTPLPPSPFLNPAACDAAIAGTAVAALTSPECATAGPSAADLWARGEALLAEIYAYLADSGGTYSPRGESASINAAKPVGSPNFWLDAERFMAELDEPPLFLRSA